MTLGFLSGSLGKPKTSLLDRAVNNLSDIAGGFVPGMLEIGHSVGNDVWAALPGTANNFKTPALGKQMGQAMWSNSALPPLLLGNPGEALKRASARPIDALLDLSLAVPATTGAAKLGMRSALTRDAAAPLFGLNKVDDATASMLRTNTGPGALSPSSPSTIGFADGSRGFSREYIGTDAFQSFGNDIYARRTHRTIDPGALPKIDQDTGATSQVDSAVSALSNPNVFAEKVPTLGEDALTGMTNKRSSHETYAQLGDAFTDLLGKIPDNRFGSASRRLGKRMTNTPIREARHASDRRQQQFEQLQKNAVQDIVELQGITPEEAIKKLDDTWLAQAAIADKDKVIGYAENFDASHGLDKIDYEELMNMSLNDAFEKHGIYFRNKNDWNAGNPIDNHTPVGKFIDEYRGELTQKGEKLVEGPDGQMVPEIDYTSPWEIRRLSKYHRDLKKKHITERDSAFGLVHDGLQALKNRGIRVQLRNRNGGETIDMSPEFARSRDSLKYMADHENYDWEFLTDGKLAADATPQESQAFADDINNINIVRELKEGLKKDVSGYNSSLSYVDDMDKLSDFYINQYKLTGNGPAIEARPGSTTLPIVERLREIGDNMLPEEMWDRESVAALMDHLSETNTAAATEVQKRFGEQLFGEDDIKANRNRFKDFAKGNQLGTSPIDEVSDLGDFIKMRKSSPDQTDTYRKSKDPVTQDFKNFNNTEPGDPWKAFLKNDFDGTMQAVLDDFSRNKNFAAGQEIFGALKQHSATMKLSKAMAISNGKAIGEAEALAGKNHAAPYVIVTEDGALSAKQNKLFKQLDDAKARQAKKDPKIALLVDELKRRMRGLEVDPESVHAQGALHDPPSLKTKTDLDDPTVHIMRSELYRAVMNEMVASEKAMNAMWEVGTEIWKYSVLHARFLGWMRNNYIGAQMMLGMNAGMEGYGREIARRYGGTAGYKEMQGIAQANMPELFGSGSSEMSRNLSRGKKPKFMQKFEEKVAEPLTNINTKYADDPAREMMLFDNIYKQMESVQKLRGETGPIDITPEVMKKFMDDDVVRGELSRRTRSQMVDFSDMSEMEKRYIRAIFPFYAWMKGSSKAMGRLVADEPGRVWGAAQVSEIGTQATEDDYGNFSPEFVDSWWNPGGGEGSVLKTSGMNPYTAFTDSIGMGASLVPNIPLPGTDKEIRTGMSYRAFGAENPLSSMHPLIGAGMEALTGKNMFFGTPIEQGSTGGGFVNKLLGGLPGSMYADRLISNKTGPDATTKYGRAIDTANFLAGIPIAQPLPGNVRSRGVDEMNERYQSPLAWRELQ